LKVSFPDAPRKYLDCTVLDAGPRLKIDMFTLFAWFLLMASSFDGEPGLVSCRLETHMSLELKL
jgi:hypothetical protein